jgi:hypothetical protein
LPQADGRDTVTVSGGFRQPLARDSLIRFGIGSLSYASTYANRSIVSVSRVDGLVVLMLVS